MIYTIESKGKKNIIDKISADDMIKALDKFAVKHNFSNIHYKDIDCIDGVYYYNFIDRKGNIFTIS